MPAKNQAGLETYLPISERKLWTSIILFILLQIFSSNTLNAQTGSDTDTGDPAEVTPLYLAVDPSKLTPEYNRSGESHPVIFDRNLRTHAEPYKSETVETLLDPRHEVEFMILADEGEVLLFSWESDDMLYHDLHGHQRDGNPDIWTRYKEGEGNKDHGSIVVPYTGDHGWYWANLGTRPVKIRLTVSGYYREIFKIDLSEQTD